MTAWVVPTARAIGWLPLMAVAALLLGVSAAAAYADRWPVGLLGIAAGAVAAAAIAGLHDPAAELLSAMPTSAWTRRAHRLVLLVPAAVAAWLGYLWPGQVMPDLGWEIGPMLALLATGVAVSALMGGHGGVALGVAVPLLWTAIGRVAEGMDPEVAEVLLAWQHHPWLVITAACFVLLMGRNR